ncbi:PREDICTED: sorting nexin-13-like isoform X1 [Papilio xuthus]|uniref:Sorting nexin-13-like isoform X1 n=1 Tax=Papilio xuthus TaxID=66420 RepID=A0AAJ7ELN1_PAPXU|nr:PREDICTED: sorting nexin-13-like isoform X1 [Papilio xuthus]
MVPRICGWFALASVITIALLGFGLYLTILTFIISFIVGASTILYLNYDSKKVFSVDIDCLDDPLQPINFTVQSSKVLDLFESQKPLAKFDNRITGSETVDSFLNEIIVIIINDYVNPWYEIITDDVELPTHSIKRLVLTAGANVANRVKSVDWIHLLSTRFPEELTTHLKLFKQSRVRLKHIQLLSAKEMSNGSSKLSPKKPEEKKLHRRNKSETDLSWLPDSQSFGKSKFYGSSESISNKSLIDLFFDLECSMENKQICRDTFCIDAEKENALLNEISEAVLYLIAPEEAWKCHSLKIILIDLLSAVVLRPLIDLLSDPDNINRTIIKTCCRDSCLSSELFLLVIRCCGDAEELDATLELVQKDIQKLHSRDSAGEWDLQDRQKLSSLQYLSRIIQAKRATLGPQEGATTSNATEKVSEEVMRSLKFIRATAAWKSNAQYLLEIELNETDAPHTSKAVLDNLRSSALELCDLYLGPNRPPVMGVPDNCHSDLVRKITTEGDEFTKNPVICFDDVQKCVCDALEDDPSWQSDFMMDNETEGLERKNSDVHKRDYKADTKKYADKCKKIMKSCLTQLPKLFFKSKLKYELPKKSNTFPRSFARRVPCNKNHTLPKCHMFADGIPLSSSRHNRSRSDVVGNLAQRMINESSGPSSLSSSYSNTLSLSHSEITQRAKNMYSPLSAYIIETALVQDKGRTFGIYAIAVTRISDNEVWHIYRRYSDFYDLHTSIKEKWPELGNLSFPAKKTFSNTSRSVLESRKRMLNNYLQSLTSIAMDARYMALLSQDYLGGFLSPEIQTERHGNTFDALFVNSIRAGMRTLKNMPDQFVNTVDGVMDGISKVFQGKSGENYYDAVKSGNSSDGQDDGDESVALRLLEEVLGIRGLWLRRRLLAPVRTLIADRVNKKVLELVSSLTSPRNVVHYLKTFKQWLTSRNNSKYNARDSATKARTRVAAKVALLSAASDDLRHIVGSDAARRGLLTVFDMLQTEEINRRLIYVLLEATLINLFPDNNFQELFKKLYSNSVRVVPSKRSVNL